MNKMENTRLRIAQQNFKYDNKQIGRLAEETCGTCESHSLPVWNIRLTKGMSAKIFHCKILHAYQSGSDLEGSVDELKMA